MPLNLQSKTSYHQFDSAGMLIIPSDQSWEKRSWWKKLWDWILKRDWQPTWSDKSWMDSLGRLILAGFAYGFIPEIINAIESCYHNGKLYRHPDHNDLASRDHHSYFYIYRKYTGQPLPDFPRMRGMDLWMKSLAGNKNAIARYYFWNIPGARMGNFWLKTLRWIGNIRTELDNKEWCFVETDANDKYMTTGKRIQQNRTQWQKLWSWIIFQTIPAYPLHNKGWQLYVMPESAKKSKLKRILLKRVGKSNCLLRLLLGDETVTQEEIDNYPAMTGFRPGVYLDETCRRDIREMTPEESEFNQYEVDLVHWLWNKMKQRNLIIEMMHIDEEMDQMLE